MTLIQWNGELLARNGVLANSLACCCEPYNPCDFEFDFCCQGCIYPSGAQSLDDTVEGGGQFVDDDLSAIEDFDAYITNVNGVPEDHYFQVPFADGTLSKHAVTQRIFDYKCCPTKVRFSSRCFWFIRLYVESLYQEITAIVSKRDVGWSVVDALTGVGLLMCCGEPGCTDECSGTINLSCDTLGFVPTSARGSFQAIGGSRMPANMQCVDGIVSPCSCLYIAECDDSGNPITPENLRWAPVAIDAQYCTEPDYNPSFLGQIACGSTV